MVYILLVYILRFSFLLTFLKFDEKISRDEHRKYDKLNMTSLLVYLNFFGGNEQK